MGLLKKVFFCLALGEVFFLRGNNMKGRFGNGGNVDIFGW